MTGQLIYLAIAIIAGFVFSYLARLVRLPNVTGYLVAGLVLGVTGIIPKDTLSGFDIISDVALGFIAFSIGGEFKLSYLKKVGAAPIIIMLLEAFAAVLAVTGALLAFGFDTPLAIMLGAIAAATAPAATLMVVRQYKADGPVTRMLLPVVAMDDAAALMAFSVCSAIAQVMVSQAALSVGQMILEPLLEIVGSLVLGAALGALTALMLRLLRDKGDLTCLAVAVVFAAAALASMLGLSSLLVCMMMGALCVNLSQKSSELQRRTDKITPPIFMLFFVISGAELDVTALASVGVVGVIYILARVVGKVAGASLGAVIAKCESPIKKYLGLTLIPQAGVAIGLSLLAMKVVPQYGATIRAVVLCATLIYELIGPVVTKLALKKAGEIKEPAAAGKKVKNAQ
ncbi:MAG: cation:proton antiporter [Firmicutes bacterium]|nr:cation:proton antiporter [Bacillota bacterium]